MNAIRHDNAVKQKQVEELQTRYNNLTRDAEEAVKTDMGESETATVRFSKPNLINLRNTFDLISIKYCVENFSDCDCSKIS